MAKRLTSARNADGEPVSRQVMYERVQRWKMYR
jgi:hypothetical protein